MKVRMLTMLPIESIDNAVSSSSWHHHPETLVGSHIARTGHLGNRGSASKIFAKEQDKTCVQETSLCSNNAAVIQGYILLWGYMRLHCLLLRSNGLEGLARGRRRQTYTQDRIAGFLGQILVPN